MAHCPCSNEPCDCDEPVEPGTGSEIFTAQASKVLGVRVSKGFARELSKACSAAGCTQSDLLRVALAKLAKSDDPAAQLASVRDALGLEPEAGRAAINASLDALFAIVGDTSAVAVDPNAAAADAPPAEPFAASKQLNAGQIIALTRRGMPATPEAWARLTRSVASYASAAQRAAGTLAPQAAVALTKAEQDFCKRKGMSAASFLAKKAGAVRKVGE